MSKNPSVQHKSRKRRRPKFVKPETTNEEKPFCPRTMVRYSDSPNEYKTVWVCKMCMVCCLSENAVHKHVAICKEATYKPVPPKNDEEIRYICNVCNRDFNRRVTLKKHQEQHEKTSDMESGESDHELTRKKKSKSISKPTPSSTSTSGVQSEASAPTENAV